MSEKNARRTDFAEVAPRVSWFKRFRRVFFSRPLVIFGLVVIVALVITAIFAAVIAPYNPYVLHLDNILAHPSSEHLLGTDTLGRDTLSRVIYGTRPSLMVGIVAIGIASFIGMSLGLIAGYFGRTAYAIIMRLIDTLMAFPMILLALTIAAVLGGGLRNIIIALGIAMIPPYARVMCAQALTIKENDYILAAYAIGASNRRVMLRHLAPNCFPPLIVLMTMMIGGAILAESSLSFLGIGINPPAAAWGAMVYEGYRYLLTNPILSFAPGLAIMLVVFSFNMVGDGLRDALDPRLRGVI